MNDYIKREDALKALSEIAVFTDVAEDVVNDIPSADVVEVRHGHWIEYDSCQVSCECSVCHRQYNLYEDDVDGYPYCPNCGARMDGEEQEHE